MMVLSYVIAELSQVNFLIGRPNHTQFATEEEIAKA